MPFATTHCVALDGATGHLIDVQADVSAGQIATVLVGRPDAALSESRDRCRMAVINSGWEWPNTRRTTILLSPADLPKRGTHFDVSIAVAVLGALDVVPPESLEDTVFIGELTLSGGLRSVRGVLPMVLAARERGVVRAFVPEPQVGEAALAGAVEVIGMRSLRQVVAELCGDEVPEAPPVAAMSGSRLLAWRGRDRLDDVDMSEVRGMPDARFAAEVAAAGGHHLLLSGPKGSGKTTLAERIPGLLPDLSREEAIELTTMHSLAGALEPGDELLTRPPYAAPHHDASKAALVGGGSGQVRPGEISRAHCGVLFMDEFPLFRTDVIDALREPLESGDITIARAEESVTLPARSLVVLAANPCPCGNFAVVARKSRCSCTETARRAYQSRVRGPITDRIDITRHLSPLTAAQADDLVRPESTEAVRARVQSARLRQEERYAGEGWRLNGQVPGPALRDRWPLVAAAQASLDQQMFSGRLTQRGAVRVHRIAWTLADLGGVDRPGSHEVEVAVRLRSGDPLMAATVARRVG